MNAAPTILLESVQTNETHPDWGILINRKENQRPVTT